MSLDDLEWRRQQKTAIQAFLVKFFIALGIIYLAWQLKH